MHYITNNAKTSAKPQQRLTCQETRFTCGFALKNKQ
ncbi:transposase, partial [Neisseria meningitidis]